MTSSICWIEIPALDLSVSGAFYTDLFGWDISPAPMDPDYALFESPGMNGGFDKRKQPHAAGVLIYLQVDDITTSLERIASAGGKVIMERRQTVPGTDDMGFLAVFSDPAGNHVGLWSAA